MAKKILIIDDAAMFLGPLQQALQQAGYHVAMIEGDSETVAQVCAYLPDLIVLNIASSVFNGLALCAQIRDVSEGAIVPILFIGSGAEQVQNPAQALTYGGDFFLRVPFDPAELLTKVATYIGEGDAGPAVVPDAEAPLLEPSTADEDPSLGRLLQTPNFMAQVSYEVQAATRAYDANQAPVPADMAGEDAAWDPAEGDNPPLSAINDHSQQLEQQLFGDLSAPAEEAEANTPAMPRSRPTPFRAPARPATPPEPRGGPPHAAAASQALTEASQFHQLQRARIEERQRWEATQPAPPNGPPPAASPLMRPAEAPRHPRGAPPPARPAPASTPRSPLTEPRPAPGPRVSPRLAPPAELPPARAPAAAPRRAAAAPALRFQEPSLLTGSLLEHDSGAFLGRLWQEHVTGTVSFHNRDIIKALRLEDGQAVEVSSTDTYDRIEEHLLRSGKVMRATYNNLRLKQFASARQACSYLVNQGLLKPDEVFTVVRDHLQDTLFGLLEWQEGAFEYHRELAHEEQRVVLDRGFPAILAEGIRRRYPLERLRRIIGSHASLVAQREGMAAVVELLDLNGEEKKLLRLIDGQHSIDDLVFSSGLTAERVYQLLYALLVTGCAQVLVRGVAGVDREGKSTGDTVDRQRISAKLEQVKRASYFEILGVSPSATEYEVEHSYQRLARELAIKSFSPAIQEELARELEEVRRGLDEAFDVLRDAELKAAYSRSHGAPG